MSWLILQQKLAELFNVYPTSLQAQYRFSTEKAAFPCDLTCQGDLDTVLILLKPLIVPPRTSTGRPSTRKMKPVSVQIFNRGSDPEAARSAGKPGAGTAGKVCFL
jgi:hypothetical protein